MTNILYTVLIYPLHLIIELIYSLCYRSFGNEGLAVIGVSAGITLLCLPLYAVAEHWQRLERAIQQKLKPGLERIKLAFHGDERYMITATFYRENRYSPIMALRSSFGLLIQIPFFIAAYNFLSHLEALRGQSFLFIRDMGKPDALFAIGGFNVNVLPIAMTLVNIAAGAVYTKGLAFREKAQIYGMALAFLVILYNSPSGLVLYWTMNNVLSLVKNVFYTFKKPLTAFWLCMSIVATAGGIYMMVALKVKLAFRLTGAAAVVCIWLSPCISRGIRYLVENPLRMLKEQRTTRLLLFVLSAVLLTVLTGLTLPASLIASSPVEFADIGTVSHPLFFIGNTFTQSLGLCLVWPLCLYLLFNSYVQTAFCAAFYMLSAGALLNSFVFMLSYGDISASLTFLNAVRFNTASLLVAANIAALAALCVVCIFLVRARHGKVAAPAFGIITAALVFSAAASLFKIDNVYRAYRANTEQAKQAATPVFKLSKTKQNVVLFMLDRAQSQFLEAMFKEDPNLKSQYDGFAFYPNTLSFNGHTFMGAPALFGGYEYTPDAVNERGDELLVKKHNEALLLLPRLFTEEAGFSATVTDPAWANYSQYPDYSIYEQTPAITALQTIGPYTALWFKARSPDKDFDGTQALLERNLLMFSLFRESPVCLREAIYYKGRYWNSNENLKDVKIVIDNYAPLDFLCDLTSVIETPSGTYTAIENELTHCSFYLQAPEYTPVKQVTDFGTSQFAEKSAYSPQMAAFKRIGTWLDFLKNNGIYDNTRIVIVSDHGSDHTEADFVPDTELDRKIGRGYFHPLLMFKDFNSHGPLISDPEFMTNADVPSMLLRGIVQNPVNPFTQKAIPLDTSSCKQNGVMVTTSNENQAYLFKRERLYPTPKDSWWRVQKNIFSPENWTHEVLPD